MNSLTGQNSIKTGRDVHRKHMQLHLCTHSVPTYLAKISPYNTMQLHEARFVNRGLIHAKNCAICPPCAGVCVWLSCEFESHARLSAACVPPDSCFTLGCCDQSSQPPTKMRRRLNIDYGRLKRLPSKKSRIAEPVQPRYASFLCSQCRREYYT